MPLNFPSSPSLDQTYTFSGRAWRWNGAAWDVVAGGAPFIASATAPSAPSVGDRWMSTRTGALLTYLGSQWAEV